MAEKEVREESGVLEEMAEVELVLPLGALAPQMVLGARLPARQAWAAFAEPWGKALVLPARQSPALRDDGGKYTIPRSLLRR